MATKKKATVKAAPSKATKAAAKVVSVKQSAKSATKSVAKKTEPAKKSVAQKAEPVKKAASAKKPIAKKPEPKKPAPKTPVATKPVEKKSASKKSIPVKAPVAQKPVAKKPASKKTEPVKKPASAKTPAATKSVVKKSEPVKQSTSAKKAVKEKTPVIKKAEQTQKPSSKVPEKVKTAPIDTKASTVKTTKGTKPGKDTPNSTPVKPVVTGMRATSPLTPKYPVLRPKGDHKKSASVRHITRTPFKDADLEEFKRRLLEERERKIKLQNSMSADALSRPDEENVEEDGTNSANRADMLNRAEETRKSLLAIDDALRAIENKTYGICSVCKCAITRERLRAAPFAIRCVKCKEEWERQVKASKRSMNL